MTVTDPGSSGGAVRGLQTEDGGPVTGRLVAGGPERSSLVRLFSPNPTQSHGVTNRNRSFSGVCRSKAE